MEKQKALNKWSEKDLREAIERVKAVEKQ